eukprot:2124261-Pyramimonas_sp.AAC.1
MDADVDVACWCWCTGYGPEAHAGSVPAAAAQRALHRHLHPQGGHGVCPSRPPLDPLERPLYTSLRPL